MITSLKFALVAPEEADSPGGDYSGEGLVKHVRSLFDLAGVSGRLVDDFHEADIIMVLEPCLISDHRKYAKNLLQHSAVRLYPERCYTYNSIDLTHAILPGLYVSLPKERADPWFHSGAPHIHFPNHQVNRIELPEQENRFDRSRLACFRGSQTSRLRHEIFIAAERNLFSPAISVCRRHGAFFANGEEGQRSYCEEIRDHAFSLAPAGHGPSTFRLYESMALGRAPVVMADSWMPPAGVAWHECCLVVPERDLGDIERILVGEFHRAPDLGAYSRFVYQKHFAPASVMAFLVDSLERIHLGNPYPKDPGWRKNHLAKAAEAVPAIPYKRRLGRTFRKLRRKLG